MRLNGCFVDHHCDFLAMFGGAADYRSGEDARLAPVARQGLLGRSERARVHRLHRVLCCSSAAGASRPRNPLRLGKIIPFKTRPSSTAYLTLGRGRSGRKRRAWPSARCLAKRGRSCHSATFQALPQADPGQAMHPEPDAATPSNASFLQRPLCKNAHKRTSRTAASRALCAHLKAFEFARGRDTVAHTKGAPRAGIKQ